MIAKCGETALCVKLAVIERGYMEKHAPRWQQRLHTYSKALHQLSSAIDLYRDTEVDIIKEGIIQRFEFTHELAWKLLKEILLSEGFSDVIGSRSATREAF